MTDASPAPAGPEVLWHVTMSADGFIAGPDDEMDWLPTGGLANPVAAGTAARVGAVLCGRRTWDMGNGPNGSGKVYGGAFDGPIFVMTRGAARGPNFLTGDLRAAVGTALAAAGGRDLLLLGAGLARSCVAVGLVDRLVLHVAPVLLGRGIRLYEGAERVALRGEVANLRYTF